MLNVSMDDLCFALPRGDNVTDKELFGKILDSINNILSVHSTDK